MTRRRKIAIVALLSLAGFIALAAVLEGGARLLGFQSRSVRRHSWLRQFDPVLGWVYEPNSRFPVVTTQSQVFGSTDGDGFRPLIGNAGDPASPVILCIGDSFTFGVESPDDRTWPECLSRALAARGRPCRVLNRGVTGYSPLQSLALLRQTPSRDPRASKIHAVLYFYSLNDPSENFAEDRPHFESASLKSASPRILPPMGTYPNRRHSFLRKLHFHSAFMGALESGRPDLSEEAYRKGARGNADYFSPMLSQFLSSELFQEGMRTALRELKKECDARSLPLWVASGVISALEDPGPRREFAALVGWTASQADERLAAYQASSRLVRSLVEEAGGVFIDLQGSLGGLSYRDSVAAPDDWHYSAAVNERIGNAFADRLPGLRDR